MSQLVVIVMNYYAYPESVHIFADYPSAEAFVHGHAEKYGRKITTVFPYGYVSGITQICTEGDQTNNAYLIMPDANAV